MVGVDPKPQRTENGITGIDDAVAVATILRIVIDGQCAEAIRGARFVACWAGRLRSEVAEELLTAVDQTIGSGQRQERIVRTLGRPGHLPELAVTLQVEHNAIGGTGQVEALPGNVKNDW